MNRFAQHREFSFEKLWQFFSLLFIAVSFFFFFHGIHSVDATTLHKQAENLENSIRRSVAHCYAVEGTYPPSLNYLKEHYGLSYDTDLFYVDYTTIGSNLMPDITIIPKYNE